MTNSLVLVLNESALPRESAGGTRHVELFSRLQRWDARVLAANRSFFDRSIVQPSGVLETVWVPPSKGNNASRVLRWGSYMATSIARGMRSPRPQVVWGSSPPMTAALAGFILARLRRAAFVVEVRDLWPHILAEAGMISSEHFLYRCLKRLERFLYRRADLIIVLAEGSIPKIVAEGIALEKIRFVPNGADPIDFVVEQPRAALRAKYGLDRFTVVYAGAHGPANGLGVVLDAAASLSAEDAEIQFLLVGDGPAKEALVSRAQRESIDNVTFLDPISKQIIPELLSAADAGLHCLADIELFRSAVSPNKLYDYMAAGLPVITNTGGDIAAMVDEATSGLACAVDGIADAARILCNASQDKLTFYSDNGIAWMAANRSRSAMAARVESILDEVLS